MNQLPGDVGDGVRLEPMIWIDVTDLNDFLRVNSSVTGIQRVAASILAEIDQPEFGYAISAGRIGICCYDFEHDEHVVISHGELLQKIADFKTSIQLQPAPPIWSRVRSSLGRLLPAAVRPLVRKSIHAIARALYYRPFRSKTPAEPASRAPACQFRSGDVLAFLGAFWFRPHFMNVLVRVCHQERMRFVLLVHDLIPVRYPTWFDQLSVLQWSNDLEIGLRSLSLLLTGSKFAAADLEAFCVERGIARPNIAILRWGDTVERIAAIGRDRRVDRYASPGYALMVSSIDRRKNQTLLINVWRRLFAKHGNATPYLILIGKFGTGADSIVETLKDSSYMEGRVVILSDVNDQELAVFYQNAMLTVYSSLTEGWGLPVAESLAYGKVCLASNAASIPEVAGPLAQYFDPHDEDACYKLVEEYLFDSALRGSAEQRIREQYRPTPWRDTTHSLLDAISNCMAQSGAIQPR